MIPVRTSVGSLLVLASLTPLGCGGPGAPPSPGDSMGAVPDLTGVRVMAFPVQSTVGVAGDATAELAFALDARAPGVAWVGPEELRSAAARSPGLNVSVDRLPVSVFLRQEVRRVGDPLYGNLRRMAALVDAEAALIPVRVAYRPVAADAGGSTPSPATGAPGGDAVPSGEGRVEVTAALLDAGSGRVVWFGVVAGETGTADAPATLASALDRFARGFGAPARR